MADLGALALSAFLASTLLPGGSEVVLGMLAAGAQHDPWLLVVVATAANTLGGMSTWLLGRIVPAERWWSARAEDWVERVRSRGAPILVLAWAPLIGDALCLLAGWLRISWRWSLVWMTLGRAARYAVIVAALS